MEKNFVKNYNDIAAKYYKIQKEFYKNNIEYSRRDLYKLIGNVKGKKILDVGCGFGEDIIRLTNKGAKVFGIDPSERMLEIAKNNVDENLLKQNSAENIDFPENTFDVVYSRYALQYVNNLDKAFKEIHRILKNKGILVFLTAHPILHYYLKKDKNTYITEIIDVPIYNNKIIIKEKYRELQEYIQPLIKYFEILEFKESEGLENDPQNKRGFIVPDYFIIKAKKRNLINNFTIN